jgi:hypothetical protein
MSNRRTRALAAFIIAGTLLAADRGDATVARSKDAPPDAGAQLRAPAREPTRTLPTRIRRLVAKALEELTVPKP